MTERGAVHSSDTTPVTGMPAVARVDRPALSEGQDEACDAFGGRKIYTRRSATPGVDFFYADFRLARYASVGGRRRPLCPKDSDVATTDAGEACALYDRMEARYEARLLDSDPSQLGPDPALSAAAAYHLRRKKLLAATTPDSLEQERGALRWVIRVLNDPQLSAVTVPMLEQYVADRRLVLGTQGAATSDSTIRGELNALSGVFKRAIALGIVDANPVALMPYKPRARRAEAYYLDRQGVAMLLDAAVAEDAAVAAARAEVSAYKQEKARRKRLRRAGGRIESELRRPTGAVFAQARGFEYNEVLVTLIVYTGMRHGEARGVRIETDLELDLEQAIIEVQPHPDRPLKREWCARSLDAPPALEVVLRHHLAITGRTSGLLLPNRQGKIVTSFAKPFRRVVRRAGLDPDLVTPHALRHSFAALRMRAMEPIEEGGETRLTLDDVAMILGQRSSGVLRRIYHHVRGRLKLRRSVEVEHLRRSPAERLRATLPAVVPQRARSHVFKVP